MKLTARQAYELLEKNGSYITEICDRCGKGIGPVRLTRKDDPGVCYGRECRDGKEAHPPEPAKDVARHWPACAVGRSSVPTCAVYAKTGSPNQAKFRVTRRAKQRYLQERV